MGSNKYIFSSLMIASKPWPGASWLLFPKTPRLCLLSHPIHIVPELVVLAAHVIHNALLVFELLAADLARIDPGLVRVRSAFVHEGVLLPAQDAIKQFPRGVQLHVQLVALGRPVDFPTVLALEFRQDAHLSAPVERDLVVLVAQMQGQTVRLGESTVADVAHVWRFARVDPYVDLERYRLGE